jgi:predicted RNase H-like HicB family nuclease
MSLSLELFSSSAGARVVLGPERAVTHVNARQTYHVALQRGQDGWIVAKCLELPGAISQGKTVEEAQRNIIEAISLLLEDIHKGEAQEFSIVCFII